MAEAFPWMLAKPVFLYYTDLCYAVNKAEHPPFYRSHQGIPLWYFGVLLIAESHNVPIYEAWNSAGADLPCPRPIGRKDGRAMSGIKRVSLSQQVHAAIIDYVQEHDLQVGDKLPTEEEFAELLHVSRTSVREATKALCMSGAVESIPGKGSFLRPPMLHFILNRSESPVFQAHASISQIMEVRMAVELLAADLAIERATEEDIQRVADAMEALRHAVLSQTRWAAQGATFHIRIAESAKNPLIVKLVESYSDTVGKYRDAMVNSNTDTDMDHHIQEHEAILQALRARDKKAMHTAIRRHLKNTEKNLQRLVDQNSAADFINQ